MVVSDVFYKGTRAEWEALKEAGAFTDTTFSCGAIGLDGSNSQVFFPIYYYSENEPPLNEDGTAYDDNYWHYAEDGVTPVIWKK